MIYALAVQSEETVTVFRSLAHILAEHFGKDSVSASAVHLVAALLCIVVPYLLGSVNPAILYTRRVCRVDIRTVGSGNADAGNVLLSHNRWIALLILLCDFAKAALASYFGLLVWGFNGRALASFFVLFGHMFPVFHRFVGGKGIAVWSMTVLLISPVTFLLLAVVLAIGAIGTRMMSFGALLTALMYPLFLNALYKNSDLSVAMAVLTLVFFFVAYRVSIKQILRGTEPKFELSQIWAKLRGK